MKVETLGYEQELSNLKEKVSDLDKDVAVMKENMPRLERTLEENTKAYSSLIETLHGIDKSMLTINTKIDTQGKDIQELQKTTEETNEYLTKKIKGVEAKINTVDEEGKLNIRTFFQKYFPWIVVAVGIGMYYASTIVEF